MPNFTRKVSRILFDPRLVVGVVGVVLSIIFHEAFHILIHWGEIQTISLFPDHNAIVEIFFVPNTGDVDIAFEEATAYLITVITLVLTVMLINDISEARDSRSVDQILFPKKAGSKSSKSQSKSSSDNLARMLGVKSTSTRKK